MNLGFELGYPPSIYLSLLSHYLSDSVKFRSVLLSPATSETDLLALSSGTVITLTLCTIPNSAEYDL